MQVRYLLRGEERLKLPPGTIRTWIRGGYAPPRQDGNEDSLSPEEAYDALGLSASASDKEVKAAYRARAAEFHPDKLKSKNLPDQFIAFASDQLARINEAHQVIRTARGMK